MTAVTNGHSAIADKEQPLLQGVASQSEKASKPVAQKKPAQAPVQDTISSWADYDAGWHAGHIS